VPFYLVPRVLPRSVTPSYDVITRFVHLLLLTLVFAIVVFCTQTTICEALAERLGWDFLVVDTSVFLADGLSNVASRIRYVFERLQALEKCVILFDEIEEFALDRETPGLSMESRMLTTAMLTAINDLRRNRQSIFFIATNRLRAFDSAITRPGRFDLQIFVGTPNLEARVIMLRQSLSAVSRPDTEKKSAIEAYRSFLESVWSEDLMFMNYLEGKQYATACANIVASGRPLTYEEMERILRTQAAVMTVRGQVRDDYLASMNLSRL
jgi:SpoVK/Ycf46/Vps4 family AAA+-type ATPase